MPIEHFRILVSSFDVRLAMQASSTLNLLHAGIIISKMKRKMFETLLQGVSSQAVSESLVYCQVSACAR